jgi:hypothetical protein
MKRMVCQSCGADTPMNDLFQVFDRTLCQTCGEKDLAERKPAKAPPGSVTRLSDPTVCAFCKSDHDSLELTLMSGVPACLECQHKFLHPALPRWVQAAAAAILILAGVELARNWRLFQAFFEIPAAHRALAQGNLAEAWRRTAAVAGHVPEIPELRAQEQIVHAMLCLQQHDLAQAMDLADAANRSQDPETIAAAKYIHLVARAGQCLDEGRNTEVIELGREVKADYPRNPQGDELIENGRIGEAFDHKDYATFALIAGDTLARHPDDPAAAAQMASALACQYAVTGQDTYRVQALAMMDRARQNAAAHGADITEYQERILYRLKTRDIIDKKEYDRRFRAGQKGQTP